MSENTPPTILKNNQIRAVGFDVFARKWKTNEAIEV